MESTIDHHAMGLGMAQLCIQKAVHAELRELCQTGDQRMMDMHAALSGAEFEIEFMETFSRPSVTLGSGSRQAERGSACLTCS